jgi:Effector-associated domain 1/Trypsin-like peptidase domain
MALTGAQAEQLQLALKNAFRSRDELKMMLRYKLNKQLNDYAAEGIPQPRVIFQLVEAAESEGWVPDLVAGAIQANPNNEVLRAFYGDVWLALGAPGVSRERLQTLIRPGEVFQDVDDWIDGLTRVGSRVCCIQISANAGSRKGEISGTGFLIGPDVVLTNFHVMEPVILGAKGKETEVGSASGPGVAAKPSDVQFRFDYRALPNGTPIGDETIHTLKGQAVEDWLVDWSPISAVDLLADPGEATPTENELDYALVRLSRAAADDVIPRRAAKRDFIALPAKPQVVTNDEPLLILQHPGGKPLKLAFHAVMAQNKNNTRVTYKVATEHGSSGSPCFNYKWDLIALHHAGDPGYKSPRNEGVPLTAIRERLTRQAIQV